jgi:hypothetical protein
MREDGGSEDVGMRRPSPSLQRWQPAPSSRPNRDLPEEEEESLLRRTCGQDCPYHDSPKRGREREREEEMSDCLRGLGKKKEKIGRRLSSSDAVSGSDEGWAGCWQSTVRSAMAGERVRSTVRSARWAVSEGRRRRMDRDDVRWPTTKVSRATQASSSPILQSPI